MKFLGEEVKVNIKRKIEYVVCDKCGKKLGKGQNYVEVGIANKSSCCDDNYYDKYDCCLECAKQIVNENISQQNECISIDINEISEYSTISYDKYRHKLVLGEGGD